MGLHGKDDGNDQGNVSVSDFSSCKSRSTPVSSKRKQTQGNLEKRPATGGCAHCRLVLAESQHGLGVQPLSELEQGLMLQCRCRRSQLQAAKAAATEMAFMRRSNFIMKTCLL